MPEAQEQSGLAARQDAELVRVLMPSPLGPLGVELSGVAVTRLRIDPPEPERASFTPFHQLDGSDLLDEVFGRLSESTDQAFTRVFSDLLYLYRRVFEQVIFSGTGGKGPDDLGVPG